jgi:D-alanyl-D-alanine carboxypeptidase (penicillin-binding protein 5/6)
MVSIRRIVLSLLLASATCFVHAAESYIIADAQTGYILAAKDRDAKLPVASLTKIATALVVLDWAKLKQADLSAEAEITAAALEAGGSNPVGLQAGDRMSLRDLLYCSLLASDNIAATALAGHVGAALPNAQGLDPVGNFVAHMNALARSLGMKRTLFLNPVGLDNAERGATPYSTAADMARLTRYAYDVPGFPFYVAQVSRQVHVNRGGVDMPFEIKNTNELLGRDGIDGVKTGTTRRAGECLVLSADRPPESHREGATVFVTPKRIIIVLLQSQDRFGEGLSLYQKGWGLYDTWASQGRKTGKSQAL